MLSHNEIQAYGAQLVLCPHCGADGTFSIISSGGIDTVQTLCKGCGHTSDDFYPTKGNVLRLVAEWAEGSPARRIDLPTDAPLIVNYGAGADSTAFLIAMVRQGLKPQLILFADPGGEKPETYAYLDYFDAWLQSKGFPGITRVKYEPVTAPYDTLEGNVLANETLPSISFFKKSCTLKFKAGVMDAYLLGISRGPNKKAGWKPAVDSLKKGILPVKTIGYDAGPIDSCRGVDITEDKNFRYFYPLRQLKWSREDCIAQITREGLQVPIKSACYYCASSKAWEIYWLGAEHPDLLARALVIEDTAKHGKHGLTGVNGLWGKKESWREFCETNGIIAKGGYDVVMDKAEMLSRARETKPPLESNLDFSLPGFGTSNCACTEIKAAA